jgi:hypothetical protein
MSSQTPIIGFTAELERQAWDDEGREKDRQKALSDASEGDGLALGGLEGLSSAGVFCHCEFDRGGCLLRTPP